MTIFSYTAGNTQFTVNNRYLHSNKKKCATKLDYCSIESLCVFSSIFLPIDSEKKSLNYRKAIVKKIRQLSQSARLVTEENIATCLEFKGFPHTWRHYSKLILKHKNKLRPAIQYVSLPKVLNYHHHIQILTPPHLISYYNGKSVFH